MRLNNQMITILTSMNGGRYAQYSSCFLLVAKKISGSHVAAEYRVDLHFGNGRSARICVVK